MNVDTVIIIPVYNEGKVIRNILKDVLSYFSNVVCIDDGSADNSISQIEKTPAILLSHPFNMGQGAALQTGIEFARSLRKVKYFVTFDADGQHRIEDVLAMIKKLRTGKYDIVLGSRFLGSAENIKRNKLVALKLAIRFSNATSGLRLTDTHNGLRVFNRLVADTIEISTPDMGHASEILEKIAIKKYRYVEVPVVIKYDEYSMSKGQTIINAINIGFDVLLRKIVK